MQAALTILPLSSRHCCKNFITIRGWGLDNEDSMAFFSCLSRLSSLDPPPPPKKKPFPLFSKFIRILCFVPEDCWHFTHAQFRCNFRLTIQDQLVLVSPLKWCLRGERVVADLEQKAEVSTQQPESRRLRVLTGLATVITIGLCHRRARDPPL